MTRVRTLGEWRQQASGVRSGWAVDAGTVFANAFDSYRGDLGGRQHRRDEGARLNQVLYNQFSRQCTSYVLPAMSYCATDRDRVLNWAKGVFRPWPVETRISCPFRKSWLRPAAARSCSTASPYSLQSAQLLRLSLADAPSIVPVSSGEMIPPKTAWTTVVLQHAVQNATIAVDGKQAIRTRLSNLAASKIPPRYVLSVLISAHALRTRECPSEASSDYRP